MGGLGGLGQGAWARGPGLGGYGRTDGWTDGRMYGRMDKISPAFYRTSPLWVRCPAHNLYNIKNQWSTDNIWSVVTWSLKFRSLIYPRLSIGPSFFPSSFFPSSFFPSHN